MHFGDYRQDFAGGVREPVLVASPFSCQHFRAEIILEAQLHKGELGNTNH
jgi:hypothetical protein